MSPDADTRVLFVTRRFPPSVGGMQTLAADVDRVLRTVSKVDLVALRSASPVHLAWFLPAAALKTAAFLVRRRVSRVVCGDAITWAAVAPVVKAAGAKGTVMVLGLDLSYPNPLYQRWIRWALPLADRVVAISEATADAAVSHAVDPNRLVVVNPGVECDDVSPDERARARNEVIGRLDLDPDKLIVVTVGRLVRRKGVAWFVERVLPDVAERATYVVAGNGPMRDEIEAVIAACGRSEDVRLLGRVDDDLRELLLRGADLCVMPNIRVPGDMEGFGLFAIEAACRGALVVASALEGIADAVADGETGILVEPEQPERFVEVIAGLAADRVRLADLAAVYQREARRRFSLDAMATALPRALGLA